MDGLSYSEGFSDATTGNPTKYCVLEIFSYFLYHVEYSTDYTEGSADYPTFSLAYLVFSTSH